MKDNKIIKLKFGTYVFDENTQKADWVSSHETSIDNLLKNKMELYASNSCLLELYKKMDENKKKELRSLNMPKELLIEQKRLLKGMLLLGSAYQNIIEVIESGEVPLEYFQKNIYNLSSALKEDYKQNKTQNYIRINAMSDLEYPQYITVPLDLTKLNKLSAINIKCGAYCTEDDRNGVVTLLYYLLGLPYSWCKTSKYVDVKTISKTISVLQKSYVKDDKKNDTVE